MNPSDEQLIQIPKSRIHDWFFKFIFRILIENYPAFAHELMKICLPSKFYNLFDWRTLTVQSGSEFDSSGKERFPDLVFSVKPKSEDNITNFLMLLEHKSYYDANMLLQVGHYQLDLYRHTKNPIMPIVVYHGRTRHWNGPLKLRNLLNKTSEATNPMYDRYVMGFECIMLNIHDVIESGAAKDTILEPPLVALSEIWRANLDTVEKVWRLIARLDKEIRQVLIPPTTGYFSNRHPSTITTEDIIKIEEQIMPEERVVLALFQEETKEVRKEARKEGLQEGLQKGRQEGLQEGRQEGLQEGLQKGLQKGRQEGLQEGLVKVAEKMLRSGRDIADVCKFTTLEREQVEAIDRSLDDH